MRGLPLECPAMPLEAQVLRGPPREPAEQMSDMPPRAPATQPQATGRLRRSIPLDGEGIVQRPTSALEESDLAPDPHRRNEARVRAGHRPELPHETGPPLLARPGAPRVVEYCV